MSKSFWESMGVAAVTSLLWYVLAGFALESVPGHFIPTFKWTVIGLAVIYVLMSHVAKPEKAGRAISFAITLFFMLMSALTGLDPVNGYNYFIVFMLGSVFNVLGLFWK